MNLQRLLCLGLVLLAVSGCNNPAAELSKKVTVVAWPELTALHNPEISMPLFRGAAMNDAATVKKTASDPKLVELVTAFENSKIPSEFASPARETAKAKAVEGYKKLIASSKSGGIAELRSHVQDIQKALGELQDANLK